MYCAVIKHGLTMLIICTTVNGAILGGASRVNARNIVCRWDRHVGDIFC